MLILLAMAMILLIKIQYLLIIISKLKAHQTQLEKLAILAIIQMPIILKLLHNSRYKHSSNKW